MIRISNFESDDLRALNELELQQVSGGAYDDGGCIRLPTIGGLEPPAPPWTFKDSVREAHDRSLIFFRRET